MRGKIVYIFKVIRRTEIAMTVNTNGIIKSVDILKNEFSCVIVITNFKTVEPLAFDERMKRFDARVIVRIPFFRVTERQTRCCFNIRCGNILRTAVAVHDKRSGDFTLPHSLANGVGDMLRLKRFRQRPRYYFA